MRVCARACARGCVLVVAASVWVYSLLQQSLALGLML